MELLEDEDGHCKHGSNTQTSPEGDARFDMRISHQYLMALLVYLTGFTGCLSEDPLPAWMVKSRAAASRRTVS